MSCFGATISSALILSKNEEKYEERKKKVQYFFFFAFSRAQLRNFYLEMHQGSAFIEGEGEVFPRDVTTSFSKSRVKPKVP